MTISAVTTQNATNASGAVAIVSASASTKALTPSNPIVMEVISYSEYIAAFSAVIMVISFAWGIYAGKKRAARESENTLAIKRLADAKDKANQIERDKLQAQLDAMKK